MKEIKQNNKMSLKILLKKLNHYNQNWKRKIKGTRIYKKLIKYCKEQVQTIKKDWNEQKME